MSTILNESQTTATVNIPTTTETAVLNTPVLFSGSKQAINVHGIVNITAGTGTTAVVLRLRQGNGVAGAVIATHTVTLAAAALGDIPFDFEDTLLTLFAAAGGQYTVTVQQTGATAAGTVNVPATMIVAQVE